VSDGLNSEALRVVKMLPNFKPALRNGKPVNVYINLPVSFRLERSKNEITLGQKLSRDKNFKSAYTNYAFEKYEDAIKYFKKSIIEFPFDYMSYELKGECEMALGNTYMACKDFRLALQNGSPTAAKL
jgi:tetratricopeptide (TPR) repeat protein